LVFGGLLEKVPFTTLTFGVADQEGIGVGGDVMQQGLVTFGCSKPPFCTICACAAVDVPANSSAAIVNFFNIVFLLSLICGVQSAGAQRVVT
jgi:hypothetical protein